MMNFQPPIGSLSNTDGPTYPLEVSTDKYYYSVGERVEVTITNVGEDEVTFNAIPPDLYIVDTALRIVVDTRNCIHADAIIKIPPGESYPHFWDQEYIICDPNGNPMPPSGIPVDKGKYLLSAGMDGSHYGGIVADIWDSVWIEIGPVNLPPVADAGPDQTVNEGDTIQFNGTGSTSPASGTGKWENKSLEPFPAHGPDSVALDGLIYYIGGDPIDCIVEPTNQTIVYDPVANTSTWLSFMPGARQLHGVTAANGKIYAIGGSDGIYSTNTVFEYDPLTNKWTTKAPMPIPMEAFGIATVNDKIYTIGGWSTFLFCYPCGEVYEYDPIANNWTMKASMPTSRAYLTATALDGKIYAIGGDAPGEVGTLEVYDPLTNTWTTGTSMPTARQGLSSEALDGNIYAFGGNGTGLTHLNITEVYDPASDSWSPGPNLNEERVHFGSATVGDCIYALGGMPWGFMGEPQPNSTEALCLATGELNYEWDLDDSVDSDGDGDSTNDVDATGSTPTHVYGDNGNYTVTLKVTASSGLWAKDTCNVTVLNVAPTADADGPHEGDEPHTVQFIGTFTDPGTLDTHTFQWDFDFDGSTFNVDSTEQSPTHQYLDDFNGSVAFKVTDDDGGWDLDVTHVTVNNLPPEAASNGPYNSFEGTPVIFTGNHTDPGPLDTHSYEWDLDYDGATFSPDATGNLVQKTWYDDYTGNIALRVTDDDGGWDLDATTVTIVNVPPTADAGEDKEGYEVSTFTFNGSFFDPGTGDTHTFEWDFNYDGSVFDVDANGQEVSNTWIDDFDGYVALRVTDDDGGVGMDTAHVLVRNVPPSVELEVLPIEVDAFLRITGEKWHDVSIELYQDGELIVNGTLVRYPGNPDEQRLNLSNIQVDYSKTYSAVVRYTPEDDPISGQPNGANPCWIILRFSDGQELWMHHTFNVQHPETHVWEVDLTTEILLHGMTFQGTAFDPGADELTFHWDFGDGTNATSFYSNANGTYPVQITEMTYPVQITEMIDHVFPGSGTYVVVLTIEDDDGGVGTASLTIVIP
jgi:PKD repeat protein